ncbi:MAG TPA: hypothetical protein VFA20_04355 [Myxococcaceae bacterium]|nr:hypothetical protein [Myxococcaceae bacterium]
MRTPALGLAVLALSACGPTFGHLPGASLRISKETNIHDDTDFTEAHAIYVGSTNGCELLSEHARATANGVELTEIFRGSAGYNWIRTEPTCDRPRATIPASLFTGPEMSVTIEDEGGSVGMTVLNLQVTPTVTVTPDASGHIRAGSTITLSYEPQTDDPGMACVIFSPHAPVMSWSVFEVYFKDAPQGDELPVTIPSDTPAGTAAIQFFGQRFPQVARCDGVDTCSADYHIWNIDAAFTIEP